MSDTKQKAEEAINSLYEHGFNSAADELRAYIQELEAQVPRWISVSERLPEEGQKVLAFMEWLRGSEDSESIVSSRYEGGKWLYANGEYGCMDVTHWTPLCCPPVGQ